ncbi:hypothetical protein ACJX0J_018326, partial [Zea mays]
MSDSYCPDCKKQTEVAFDHSAGDTVCTESGLVLEAHSVDETSEWRTFANESNDNDPVRVGGPSNPLLTDGGLSTVIAKPNGAQGDFLSSSLGRWQNRGSNPDRSLILAFRTIANMADRVLPAPTVILLPYLHVNDLCCCCCYRDARDDRACGRGGHILIDIGMQMVGYFLPSVIQLRGPTKVSVFIASNDAEQACDFRITGIYHDVSCALFIDSMIENTSKNKN